MSDEAARFPEMRRSEGELFELVADPAALDPRYANADLLPTPVAKRTWTTYHVASLWVGLAVCIPTYILAAGLIDGGMSAWQALATVLLGNLIVLLPMTAIAHAGTRYGLSFPVLARAAFGVDGAHVPALLRAGVACGWFGIQTWIGGQAIDLLLATIWSGWSAFPGHAWIAFALFWGWNMWVAVRGSDAIKALEAYAAPLLIVGGLALVVWAANRAGGLGPIFARPGKFATTAELWRFFVPSLTAMVGFWATLALNIPDLTRYARSQRSQVVGQLAGLPTTMTLFAFIGVAVTSASELIFGEAIWDPIALVSRLDSKIAIVVALVLILVATITTNVAANVVAPANGFANLWPRRISFAVGALGTGVLGILIQPWRLLVDFSAYVFGWLVGYSALLGPIAGILIADYWWVRKGQLSLPDLFRRDGIYGRVNPRAMISLALGVGVALIGLAVPALRVLFDYAWFVGFGIAFVVYGLLMRGTPVLDLSAVSDAGRRG
jgi:NCS1 family nucleobase:cation symporter-1